MMTVDSVNVGQPVQVPVRGGSVLTGIFKSPVAGAVAIRPNNLEGDQQADLTVHGGTYKAVYCYPGEHYSYWTEVLPKTELLPGMFGENLTTTGLLETEALHWRQVSRRLSDPAGYSAPHALLQAWNPFWPRRHGEAVLAERPVGDLLLRRRVGLGGSWGKTGVAKP